MTMMKKGVQLDPQQKIYIFHKIFRC